MGSAAASVPSAVTRCSIEGEPAVGGPDNIDILPSFEKRGGVCSKSAGSTAARNDEMVLGRKIFTRGVVVSAVGGDSRASAGCVSFTNLNSTQTSVALRRKDPAQSAAIFKEEWAWASRFVKRRQNSTYRYLIPHRTAPLGRGERSAFGVEYDEHACAKCARKVFAANDARCAAFLPHISVDRVVSRSCVWVSSARPFVASASVSRVAGYCSTCRKQRSCFAYAARRFGYVCNERV
jgi:hypothetical protein